MPYESQANFWRQSKTQILVNKILTTVQKLHANTKNATVLIEALDLQLHFSQEETSLIKYVFKINPRSLGFKGKVLGIKKIPSGLQRAKLF